MVAACAASAPPAVCPAVTQSSHLRRPCVTLRDANITAPPAVCPAVTHRLSYCRPQQLDRHLLRPQLAQRPPRRGGPYLTRMGMFSRCRRWVGCFCDSFSRGYGCLSEHSFRHVGRYNLPIDTGLIRALSVYGANSCIYG
eukprot:1820742-Pyramimonas_sp.AAC.1